GGEGYGGPGYDPAEDLSIGPDEFQTVRTKESKTMGKVDYKMFEAPSEKWLAIKDLPEVIPGVPNKGSDVGGFDSYHTGGANFVLGDGSVQFLSQGISPNVRQQLANRADKTLTPSVR
ncbi:MAG: H-X9-DG-CTERM domain-containing protein, partial [Planctomycetota bacterium]